MLGPLGFVGGEDDGGARGDGLAEQVVDEVAPGGVEAGVGLVEQPELGAPRHQGGQGGAAPLPGRQAVHRDAGEASGQAEALEGDVDLLGAGPGRAAPEAHVLGHREVVVEAVGVAEQTDLGAHRPRLGHQIDAEHDGLALADGHQPGEGPQQRGLPRPVRPAHEQDLAAAHVERHAGERREPTEQRHGIAKVDDRLHGTALTVVVSRRHDNAAPTGAGTV